MSYKKDEIKKVLKSSTYKGVYKIKVRSSSSETKWMNLTKDQVRDILDIVE